MQTSLQPFLLYVILIIAMVMAILLLTWVIGGRHQGGARDDVFESGIVPTGGARIQYPVKFYRVALFFLVFDLEVAFILLWAYMYKSAGWWGFWHITIFIILLFAGLVYPWLKGALDFVPSARKSRLQRP